MEALIDVMIYLVIFGGSAAAIIALVWEVRKMARKIRHTDVAQRKAVNRQYMRERLGHGRIL